MGEYDDLRELADAASPNGTKRKGWPKLPGHAVTLTDVRSYLTEAAGLPEHWQVHVAKRHGPYPTDPLTIGIRTPGEQTDVDVRFDAQRDCSKPSALRGAFAEATRGASRMKYPKPAEASDFYVMVCALAEVGATATLADETHAWLEEYLGHAWFLPGMTFTPDHRYDALMAIRDRAAFDRVQAGRYIGGTLDERERFIAIVDTQTGELWIRASEFIAYMRHVYGISSLAQNALDARIVETGGFRERLYEDRRHKGGSHVALIFYRFPSPQAFPSVSRIHTPTQNTASARTP